MATADPTTKFTKNASATIDSLQEDFSAMRDDVSKLSQQVVDLLQAKGNQAYKRARKQFDDTTGEVRVQRFIEAYDIGYAINPTIVEGQIQGGKMMGLGLALLEASYPYYPGVEHRGYDFASYAAPTMVDMPEIEFLCLENPSAEGPYGAKACGEMANNGQGPSVAMAIHEAVGVWVTELPLTPERVLRALEKKAAGEDAPRLDGKWVIFDDELSINTVGHPDGTVKFEYTAS